MVAAGVVDEVEALVEFEVVLAALEEEVLCFSSDLVVSFVLCWDSDWVFSLAFISSFGSLSNFWVGFLMTRGLSTMRFTRLSTFGFLITRRIVAELPGGLGPSPPPPPSSLLLLPSSPPSPRLPPFSRLLSLAELLLALLAPLLAVSRWYFFKILFLFRGRALLRVL